MGRGLHTGLYGKQEDTAVLLVQTTVLESGGSYELQYRYRSRLGANRASQCRIRRLFATIGTHAMTQA